MSKKPVKIRSYESTTLLENDRSFDEDIHFYDGVPRENAVNDSRLAERSLLQGAGSGLLHDRVATDAEEEKF